MSQPQTCPRCGSHVRASIPDVGIQFECAAIALESGYFSEAIPCVMRQRDQLAERVNRLKEAADMMANAYEEILCDSHDARILENYREKSKQ